MAFLQAHPRLGYVSVAEFVKDSARRRLEELEVQNRASSLGDKLDALKGDADKAAAKVKFGSPIAGRGYCHKCGVPLRGDYCSNCGTKAV